MRDYLIRRTILIPLLLLGITVIDFAFINLAPGDPVTAMLDPQDVRKMSKRTSKHAVKPWGSTSPSMYAISMATRAFPRQLGSFDDPVATRGRPDGDRHSQHLHADAALARALHARGRCAAASSPPCAPTPGSTIS